MITNVSQSITSSSNQPLLNTQEFFISTNIILNRMGKQNFEGLRRPIPSDFNFTFLDHALKNYKNKQVVDLLKFGFPLGHNGTHGSKIIPDNHKGAVDWDLQPYLDKEVKSGAAIGPFDSSPFGEDTFYSPLNSVAKKESQKRRLILDLSFPENNSINEGIEKDWYLGEYDKLELPSVDQLVEKIMYLGKGCKVFKVDLSRAYRQIYLDPKDINKVAYVYKNKVYIDTTLSMGSRSSARCCQMVTSAVVYIYTEWGYFAINYLDDLGGAEKAEKAEEAFEHLKLLLRKVGLKIALEKSAAPNTVMVFLGIEVNTILLTLTIPSDKWREIQECLAKWKIKKVANLKQVQQLTGLLNFACRCVKSGRIYLSRILNFLRTLSTYGFKVIPESVKHDVNWWIEFAPMFNGITMMTENYWSAPDAWLSSDSCLTGGGAYFNGKFIRWKFPKEILEAQYNINQLECIMVVVALKLWAGNLTRKKLVINCDNKVTVLSVNAGFSRDIVIQKCLREIHKVLAVHSCELKTEHILGVNNRISDALSRWHLNKKFEIDFNKLTHGVSTERCQVNDDVWRFLME